MPNSDLDEFVDWLGQRGRSPFTQRGYALDLKDFGRWISKADGRFVSPEIITVSIVLRYQAYLIKEKEVSAGTYNRKLAALRSYVAWAQNVGRLESDPLQRLHMIREERPYPCWLQSREVRRLKRIANRAITNAQSKIKHTQAVRDKSILMMFLNTGIRLAELCALDLMDLTLGCRFGKVHIIGSGGLSKREIKLDSEVRSSLKDWIKLRPEKGKSWAVYVGLGSGRRLAPRSVQERISRMGQRANVRVTPHILRHTYAHNLVEGGMEPDRVVQLLGQHDIYYTARTYYASRDQERVKESEDQG